MNCFKKLMALGLVGVMSVSLVACAQNSTVDTPNVEDSVVETPVVDVTPEVETPVVDAVEVTMDMISTTLRNTFGDYYLPSMPLDQETFNILTGLTSDMYTEFLAEVPMMMTHVDKLFVVKTDNTDAVAEVLNTYKTAQVEDAMQYPMNLTKLENAVVETHGEYVFYYMLGGYTDSFVEDEVEQKNIETAYYEEQNAKAHDALVALFTDGTIPEPAPSMFDNMVDDMGEDMDEDEYYAEGGDVVYEYDTDIDVSGDVVIGDGTEMDNNTVDPEFGVDAQTDEEAESTEAPMDAEAEDTTASENTDSEA